MSAASDKGRFWILDGDEGTDYANKIVSASKATGLPLVGIVDEKHGGVTAYVVDEVAGRYVELLNEGSTA